MSHTPSNHGTPSGWTEPDVIELGAIVKFAIGLAVIVALSHVAMVFTFNAGIKAVDATHATRVYPMLDTDEHRRPPEPRLQGGVQSDHGRLLLPEERFEHNPGSREALAELRATEAQAVTSYGWVDKTNQIVRLPVADAMRLTLQRGLPARETTPAAASVAAPAAQEEKSK